VKETPVLTAGKEGFALSAPDKSFQLKLRGYAQADGRFFFNDGPSTAANTFLIRRARVILDGTVGQRFEFRVVPDFGGGKTELQDAYLDCKASEWINLRFGRTKTPFGIERLQSSADTLFIETGLSSALTPNNDEGVMLYGAPGKGVLDYALGVFNGAPDGASVDADTNNGKDLAARVMLSPFKNRDVAALSGLSFGVAGTIGDQKGNDTAPGLPSIRSSGQQGIFSYKTSTNKADVAFADGNRTRLAPQFYCTLGSFGLLGEYVISEQEVANGKGSDTVRNEAWQLAASYVLTGESPSLKGVKPLRPLDMAAGNWGAFELAARVGKLEIDDAAFRGGYADRKKAVSSAAQTGVGLNWYLSRNVRLALDYEQTAFDDGDAAGDRPDERVVLARTQVAW
jgi:phosphate-selective porin OprO/OprP